MKSLIMKDLYNIGHNAKSMFFILLVFTFAFIPSSGVEGYIFVCAIVCSMGIVTTFSFDDHSNWNRYAMVMPVSRNNLVAGKFITLLIFSSVGIICGLIIGTTAGLITREITFRPESVFELLFLALEALVTAMIFGGIVIPLVFRFGAEKGRMLILVSCFVPAAICFGVYRLLILLGLEMTDQLVFVLVCCSPVIAFVWDYVMYKISCGIFSKMEL